MKPQRGAAPAAPAGPRRLRVALLESRHGWPRSVRRRGRSGRARAVERSWRALRARLQGCLRGVVRGDALRTLEQLAADGERVALALAGQWLAGMTGSAAARPGAPAAPAREAGAPDRLGRLGRPRHGRGDLRGDGARPHRLLRAAPLVDARRGLPPSGLELPARVVALAADRAAHHLRGRRVLVRARLRATRRAGALRASRTRSASPTPRRAGRSWRRGRRAAEASAIVLPNGRSWPTRATRRSPPPPAPRSTRARATSTS